MLLGEIQLLINFRIKFTCIFSNSKRQNELKIHKARVASFTCRGGRVPIAYTESLYDQKPPSTSRGFIAVVSF